MNNTFLESSARYTLSVPALLAAYKLYINELLLLCVTQKNKNSQKRMIVGNSSKMRGVRGSV